MVRAILKVLGLAALALGLLAVFFFTTVYPNIIDCREAGGTYIDNKCIDAKEIKL